MRTSAAVALVLVLLAAFALTPACSNDVGVGLRPRNPRAVPLGYDVPSQAFDAGLATTHPLREHALAAASIPRPGGGRDVLVTFLGFVTAARADDADGSGTPLDRSSTPPTDSNDDDDVFLAAVVDISRVVGDKARPAAFVQELAGIYRDPRCVRCHSFHYPGGWREDGHVGNLPKGGDEGCDVCHSDSAALVPGVAPNRIVWRAPDVAQTANPSKDFRGKSDRELYDATMTEAEPDDHLRTDDKILWAIQHGRVPFRGDAVGGRVPMDPQLWQDLVDAWALDSTFLFSTESATRDVVLVSRTGGDGAAANGASSQPSLAFEPNPAYDPGNPSAFPAGWVLVAFASTATDLVGGSTTTARSVVRSRVAVYLDANADIDLRPSPVTNVLISRSFTSTTQGADGDSSAPSISPDGRYVAFESVASDLLAGFVDGNGAAAADVFLRDVDTDTTTLQSHAVTSAVRGGNLLATGAAIHAAGSDVVVAFESDATDLVADDQNNVRDVFYVRNGGGATVARASVTAGGSEGHGGNSTDASIWVDGDNRDVWVAFASRKTDLDGTVVGAGTPAVFLHRAPAAATSSTERVLQSPSTSVMPSISPDGGRLVWVSAAADIDTARTDGNGSDDVFSLRFAEFRNNGARIVERLSVAMTGAEGNGPSQAPALAGFRTFGGSFLSDTALAFTTAASNLGRSPNSDLLLQFLIDRSNPRTVAQFHGVPRAGTLPLTVQFTDLSSNATSWAWDFGDGGNSTEQSPSHTYTTAGDFDVTLTATGPSGSDTLRKPQFISVSATPPTWTEVYTSYLTGCSSCHNQARTSSRFAMAPQSTAYGNLVGIAAVTCSGRTRVVAGNASASQMIDVLSGSGCLTNHTGGTLGLQALADLRAWIDAGAQNN